MQTLSSASRTCMASSSAVECTATVGMPSSLHARRMRSAISPRLAIRILSNISLDDHQRFAVLHRLAILDQNLDDRAGTWRGNLIHRFHRFDDDQRLAGLYLATDVNEWSRARRRTTVRRADHGRGDQPWVVRRLDRHRYRRRHRVGASGSFCRPRTRPRRVQISRDANRRAVALNLDFRKAGFFQQLRQITDHAMIDGGCFRHWRTPGLARHDQTLVSIMAARPVMASE